MNHRCFLTKGLKTVLRRIFIFFVFGGIILWPLHSIILGDLALRVSSRDSRMTTTMPIIHDERVPSSSSLLNGSDHVPWNLQMIDLPEAWRYGFGSREIVVSILDTGLDFSHPDLQGVYWTNPNEIPNNGIDDDANGFVDDVNGWDFQENDANPQDEHGHGTFLAGILAARWNDFGLVGVAPNVSIMPVRILNEQGILRVDQWGLLVDGIDYAVNNGAKIIMLSIEALSSPPQSVQDALKRAKRANVLVISPTGNSGKRSIAYPAAYPEVLAVSAVDSKGKVPSYVNRGEGTMITAPGDGINSTWLDGSYQLNRGTSFAVPHVAGIAALLWSRNGSLSVDEIWSLLIGSATSLNSDEWNSETGYGLVNASRSVRSVMDDVSPRLQGIEIQGYDEKLLGTDTFVLEVNASDDVAVFQIMLNVSGDGRNWVVHEQIVPSRGRNVQASFEIEASSFSSMFLVKVRIRDSRGNEYHSDIIDLTEEASKYLRGRSSLGTIRDILVVISIPAAFLVMAIVTIRIRRNRS